MYIDELFGYLCVSAEYASPSSRLHRVVTALLCNASHIRYAVSFGSTSTIFLSDTVTIFALAFAFPSSKHSIELFFEHKKTLDIESNLIYQLFSNPFQLTYLFQKAKRSHSNLSMIVASLDSVSLDERQCSVNLQ